ncbi:hypothetical protein WJX77_010406 [Trebouxia sp. C0004]
MEAKETSQGADKTGLDPASICRALVALGKAGKADEAESLWNQCEANGMLADEKLVGALCANFAEAAEPEKIKIAISKGKKAGLFPIPSAYSSLLKAYGQCQQWPQVREVLIGMIQSGVPINRLHYMAALRAYHKNNRCSEAEFLLTEMISQNCEPGANDFELVANMYANRKQSHMVEDVLRRWVALGNKVTKTMFAVSAKAYASQGEPDQVKRILAEMRQNSLVITPQVWGSLVYALVNAGQLEGALEVMSGLQSSGVAPSRYNFNVIINAHLKRNDEAGALYYWQLLKQSGLQPQLYDILSFMHYYRSKGNVRAVKEWQAAAAEHGVIDTGEATLGVIEASMHAWWLDGCQNLVLTTVEQEFMQSASLKLYPIFRYAKGNKGVYNSTQVDLHEYDHWSCQLASVAGLSMMYDRFLHTTWQWPKSEDLTVVVGKGSTSLTERQIVKKAAWHFLEKLFVVRMDSSGGAIVVKRVYGVVTNLGSLVARTIFFPVEEAAFSSQETSRQRCRGSQEAIDSDSDHPGADLWFDRLHLTSCLSYTSAKITLTGNHQVADSVLSSSKP